MQDRRCVDRKSRIQSERVNHASEVKRKAKREAPQSHYEDVTSILPCILLHWRGASAVSSIRNTHAMHKIRGPGWPLQSSWLRHAYCRACRDLALLIPTAEQRLQVQLVHYGCP